jgi:transposase
MAKYPGSMILNEIGTRKELAAAYGVSERTIYRWMNKARAETGEKKAKPRRPRLSTLENFKGTRKELAKKYGVSERTVYRWLDKAKKQGAEIPSRQKKKIAKDMSMPEEIITPDMLPEEIFTPDQLPEEIITEPEPESLGEDIEDIFDLPEEEAYATFTDVNNLIEDVINMDKLSPDSAFLGLDKSMQREYMYAYIKYQSQHNKDLYYWIEKIGMDDIPSESIASLNIWGDSFETFVQEQIELDKYVDSWAK